MPSSNKTPNLGLSQWTGTDVPKREDFVNDNAILDTVVNGHTADTDLHVTEEDRERWTRYVDLGVYVGDGEDGLTVTMPFEPIFVVVFASGMPLVRPNYTSSLNYNYAGFASVAMSTFGLALSGDQLTVNQNYNTTLSGECQNFNEFGRMYVYIAFRDYI
ncbi:MAG: hypothetical protein LIO46_02890 [Clostridiales bacterium]|nr:hypothetical protein [Clostridiales bacterium]